MDTWSATWAIRNLIAEFLMPPGIWLVIIFFAYLVFRQKTVWRRSTLFGSLLMIWLTATPIFANVLEEISRFLMKWPPALSKEQIRQELVSSRAPQVVVILGGGRRQGVAESEQYDYQDLNKSSIERLRYGAYLSKKTQLPILVSGGAPDRTSVLDHSEAQIMSRVLQEEFSASARWLDNESHTTQENAKNSAKLLQADGIERIFLVTHYWHMPRAQRIFEHYGLVVVAAPHGFDRPSHYTLLDFYPNHLAQTRLIWHEILGEIWYRLRY